MVHRQERLRLERGFLLRESDMDASDGVKGLVREEIPSAEFRLLLDPIRE